MPQLTIPAEGTYSDIERDFIDGEPPGLFPMDQRSVWGQVRKTYADYLQTVADLLTKWWGNLDPATVSSDDIPEWEYMLDLPASDTALTDQARRNNIVARFQRGPFTRTRRRNIIESFIIITFGPATLFDSGGILLTIGGVTMYSGATALAGSYTIVEAIPQFKYTVYILNTISVDLVGLTRELTRITPSGISFTIVQVSKLPFNGLTINSISTVGGSIAAKKQLKQAQVSATSTVSGTVTKH